jgi:ketosteroid isomerase-like protein
MMTKSASLPRRGAKFERHSPRWGSGRPEAYIDCWAKSDDATLFGAWGPIEKGYQRLVETFRWVGHRVTGGTLVPEDIVSFESGDLAYTVGFERGEVSVDANAPASMTIRVTHIYRRIDGECYLVHRHAGFPPSDQRAGRRLLRKGRGNPRRAHVEHRFARVVEIDRGVIDEIPIARQLARRGRGPLQ